MTESELKAIRRSSMARILCDNSQVGLMAMMVVVLMTEVSEYCFLDRIRIRIIFVIRILTEYEYE